MRNQPGVSRETAEALYMKIMSRKVVRDMHYMSNRELEAALEELFKDEELRDMMEWDVGQ